MYRYASIATLSALLGGCASFRAAFTPAPPQQTISITLVCAVIAAGKANGHSWDLDLPIPAELQNVVEQIADETARGVLSNTIQGETGLPQGLSLKLSNAIVNVVAKGLAIDSAPDPFGIAYVTTDQGSFPQQLLKHDNTFMPAWGVTWTGMNWADAPTLRLKLIDSDDFGDDAIGEALLSASDLSPALADGQVHAVDVRGQTNGQLIAVVFSARPENWSYGSPEVPAVVDASP